MKIHITGNAGSGKSTLARRLGDILEIPVHSLDSVVWKKGWEKTAADERTKKERELAKNTTWIIEGVSTIIREEADFIVFLDYARFSCIARAFKRNMKYLFKSRPELPENCPEIFIVSKLLKIIWNFDVLAKPNILRSMSVKEGVRIRSDKEIVKFISEVQHNQKLKRMRKKRAPLS